MDSLKNKYEFVVGFVGIAISLSAFKEELSKIIINLGFGKISLSLYFLSVIVGLVICLYFYTIEQTLRDSRIGSWSIFDYLTKIASGLFVMILVSPVLIGTIWIANLAIVNINKEIGPKILHVLSGISVVTTILSVVFAVYTVMRLTKIKKDRQQNELEIEEITELEKAVKLYDSGYYSQSILETFKVLELHLYKQLRLRNIRVMRNKLHEMLIYAQKYELINSEDRQMIDIIRKMRNSAAHLDVNHTQAQATLAIHFVKSLINKSASAEDLN